MVLFCAQNLNVADPQRLGQGMGAMLDADGYVIKSVISILARYLDASALCKVITRCCSVLDKLTKDSPEGVRCAVQCGGIECVLRVVMAWNEEKSNGHKHVVVSALCFLQNVTLHQDAHKKRVCHSGGCQHILGILAVNGKRETHDDEEIDTNIISNALKLLSIFTSVSVTSAKVCGYDIT